MPGEEDDLIAQFVGITGASASDAAQYIEMSEGDMQRAVDLYLDMGPAGGSGGNGNQASSSTDYTSSLFQEEVREAIPARYDQLIGGSNVPFESMQGWLHQAADIPTVEELEAQAVQDEFEEAGLGHLYRPPEDLNASGSLAEAMSRAKTLRKWLLVNVQAADEFSSHVLNRDIWSHETVKEVVKSSFVFWQRDKGSTQGSSVVRTYSLTSFPVILVLDPRTGRKVKQWAVEKFKGPLTAADILSDFVGEHPYGSSKPASSAEITREGSQDAVEVISVGASPAAPPKAAKSARTEEPIFEIPTEHLALPNDPEEIKVAVRLLNGQKKQVSFKASSPANAIAQWISATENLPVSKFQVRLSHPPIPVDMTNGVTVGAANVKGALLVVVAVE